MKTRRERCLDPEYVGINTFPIVDYIQRKKKTFLHEHILSYVEEIGIEDGDQVWIWDDTGFLCGSVAVFIKNNEEIKHFKVLLIS